MAEELQPQEAVNPAVEETTPEATPTSDQPTPQPEAQVATEQVEEAPADSTDEKKAPRAQRRIQDLSHQLKEAKEQLANAQLPQWDFAQPTGAEDARAQYENGEVTLEEYLQARDRQMLANAQLQTQGEIARFKAEREEEKFWNGFESDTRNLEKANPKFDPSSQEFDQEYVDELSDLYLQSFKQNIRQAPKLSEFVTKVEKLRTKAMLQGKAESSANLAEQASQQAVGGGGGKPAAVATGKESLKQKAMKSGNRGDWEAFFREDFKDY